MQALVTQMLLAACLCTRIKPQKVGRLAHSIWRWTHSYTPSYVPVVIVGAGPTGLVLSCLLSQYGVRHMILERSKQLTQHPQAHYINNRTMEVFRSISGLSASVAAASPPLDQWRQFIYCEGMAVGQILGEVDHFPGQSSPADPSVSPEPVTHLSQHRLLPLLLEKAQQISAAHSDTADIQFGKAVTAVSNVEFPHSSAVVPQSGTKVPVATHLHLQQQSQRQEHHHPHQKHQKHPHHQQQQGLSQLANLQQQQQHHHHHAGLSEDQAAQQYPVCLGVQSCDGTTQLVRCSYLAAADGANSTIRNLLGIPMSGDPSLQHLMSIHFTWPALGQALLSSGRAGMLYFVFNRQVVAVVVAHDLSRGECVAQVPYYPPLQSPADFTPEFCKQVIAAAAGWPLQQLLQNQAVSSSAVGSGHTNSSNNSSSSTSSGFQLCSVKNWVMSTLVADEYAAWGNRVILVGDSAHRFPPAGGFGMNTGIQDAHNLAWKLAAVLSCTASHSLIDSYQPERQPVAKANTNLSISNWQEAIRVPQALGLDPQAASLVNQLVSGAPLPSVLGRWVLDSALAAGRGLAAAVSPLRKSALQQILKSGQSLRLQFPREDLGFVYTQGAIAAAAGEPGSSTAGGSSSSRDRGSRFVPSTIVGGRLPHCWLLLHDAQGNPQKVSTLDLVTPGMLGLNMLLICSSSSNSEQGSFHSAADHAVEPDWLSAGRELQRSGWPIHLLQVLTQGAVAVDSVGSTVYDKHIGSSIRHPTTSNSTGTQSASINSSESAGGMTDTQQRQQQQQGVLQAEDVDGTWAQLHGGSGGVALLVRPDGHVAWRSSNRTWKVPGNSTNSSTGASNESSLVDELQHVLAGALRLLPPEQADTATDF